MGYGYRYNYHFMFPGEETGWWTSTAYHSPETEGTDDIMEESAYFAVLSYDHMFFPDQWTFKESGYYVRCVRKR